MFVKQLSIFLQNKPGHLANITELLKQEKIDIRAINVSEGNEFGILRLLVDDTYKAQYILSENNYLCRIADVLAIEPEDRVGIMAEIFRALSDNEIDLNYIYSTIRPYHDKQPIIILKTSDQEKARKVIEDLGIGFITTKEISEVEENIDL